VDGEQSIQVTNTKMMDKKVFYEVTWRDKRGRTYVVWKRYSRFHSLRSVAQRPSRIYITAVESSSCACLCVALLLAAQASSANSAPQRARSCACACAWNVQRGVDQEREGHQGQRHQSPWQPPLVGSSRGCHYGRRNSLAHPHAQVADIPNWPKKKAKVKGKQVSQEAVVRRTVHRLLRHGLPATGAGGDDGIAEI
jgi:hypothetical protein